MKNINYRHGDIALIGVKKMPNLQSLKTNVLFKGGSGGNDHTFTGGTFYPAKENFIVGYLRAIDTKLYHAEHSPKGVKIADGIYEIRHQVEYTPQGLKEVID